MVTAIATAYNKVSYHNFSHAFSLMQVPLFLSQLNFLCIELMPQFKNHFTPEELFYTFISGLSHDLNHCIFPYIQMAPPICFKSR